MKINLPIYTPKQIIQSQRIIKSVQKNTAISRQVKQRRYRAFLEHSKIGYFPNGRKETFSKKMKNLFFRIKDAITIDDLV